MGSPALRTPAICCSAECLLRIARCFFGSQPDFRFTYKNRRGPKHDLTVAMGRLLSVSVDEDDLMVYLPIGNSAGKRFPRSSPQSTGPVCAVIISSPFSTCRNGEQVFDLIYGLEMRDNWR